jgi:catechol 2,3-dioxygenase-like lactoylglutathione lyase family enzyme
MGTHGGEQAKPRPGAATLAWMIDHIKLHVADAARSRAFYERALAPLGYKVIMEPAPQVVGMGARHPDLWLAQSDTPTFAHVALRADSREAVNAFHAAALAAGGADNGPPGLRPQYHRGYYGAFVIDPDGNNLEAVHHTF